ncbi:MAG TPA: HNH endonuclease domain-containing protein, partial [Spirochaetota bacterium]|nr:HNH endonuclease domain-containing protein [Spirochaetota bacterium]
MSKILGLDLGTNSIGWAIIEEGNDEKLIDKGCIIFPEGVKEEQGKEISRAAERTSFRLARRQKFRRKLRKYNTLKVLIEYNMCPLSMDELEKWRKEKEYPKNKDFLEWLKTDEKNGISPYYYRAMAVEKKLAPTEVGRALYHITQRRGYKSNRLESTDENQKGVVNTSINEITNSKGDKTLGQYFYDLYKKGEKIRKKYTSREQHYLEEFKKICEVQGFSEELTKKLEKAIFFQRPLKSQKGLVGRCVFEKSKPRAPISHPLFEEFRMLQFINSIKYKDNNGKFVFLNENQRERIKPLFYRKSKSSFDFKDIKEKLFGNENVEFNYKNEKDVSGCPTIANFIDLFGENWKNICIKYTREKDNKESTINYETIWNVLFSFNSDEKLIEFAKKRLGFDDEKAKKFSKINLKQGYASLSLCAIRKILPFLEQGLLYTYAVYLANLDKVLKKAEKKQYKESIKKDIEEIIKTYIAAKKIEYVINSYIDKYRTNHYNLNAEKEDFKKKIENELGNDYEALDNNEKNELIDKYYNILEKQVRKNEYVKIKRLDEKINELLKTKYDIPDQALEKIYHPSDIDIYPEAKISKDGKKYLGSPRTSSIRNPMAMRTLHQLRYFINTLIKEDKISYDDQINIEVARELNDANKRAAIRRYQNELEKKRKEYAQKIRDTLHIEPTDTDILKYQLWEEQNHICIYTGREISLKDFLSDNPTYDIEHTIPRSISIDDSQENLTLCENDFNRNIKMNQIPQQLGNINEILQRI